MPKQFTYGKDEKLKSRKVIESLFSNGHSFTVYPLKVLYKIETDKEGILQAGVAVSTRQFKKAVDRNRIKRLMRESYRIQKNDLKETVALQKGQHVISVLALRLRGINFQAVMKPEQSVHTWPIKNQRIEGR